VSGERKDSRSLPDFGSLSGNGSLNKILFVFLDGVGLALPGPQNPFSQVPMPHLRELLGGPLVLSGSGAHPCGLRNGGLVFCPVDACLGVPGAPQSATGQTALFTGINAAAAVGDHVTAQPTRALREIIAQHSVLKRAAEAGARVLFANAHSEQFWQAVHAGERALGASTLTALAGEAHIPTFAELLEGRAVLWDITHEVSSRLFGYELPPIAPEEAGARLVRLAAEYDLTLYETFLPDLAGHRRLEPDWVLTRLDAFLGAVLARRPAEMTLLVCSDHGSLEDMTTKLHSTNPVPLLAAGPAARYFQDATSILDVAPAILEALRAPGGH
jgi:2,3-bisphosphoglycerate-independent phosphoglycerate mutase